MSVIQMNDHIRRKEERETDMNVAMRIVKRCHKELKPIDGRIHAVKLLRIDLLRALRRLGGVGR